MRFTEKIWRAIRRKNKPERDPLLDALERFDELSPQEQETLFRQLAVQRLDTWLKANANHVSYDSVDLAAAGTRDQFPNGKVLENPEYREAAQIVIDALMQTGGVIAHGKLPDAGGRERGDFETMFTAGKIAPLPSKLTSHVEYVGYRYGVHLCDNATPASSNEKALIDTALFHESDFFQGIEKYTDERERQQLRDFLADLKDENGNVFVLSHRFSSNTRMRGHNIPIHMTYLLPPESGIRVERVLASNPWLMEAVSEKLRQNAGKELQARTPREFNFPSLRNDPARMAQASMFQPGITQEFWALFSFFRTR